MSYCRWGEEGSTVYMIGTGSGYECVSCHLVRKNVFPTPIEALEHLQFHRSKEERVAQRAFDELQEEIDTGDWLINQPLEPSTKPLFSK